MQLLDLYGIPFDDPKDCTTETLRDAGITE
jgi:hypothetical protein